MDTLFPIEYAFPEGFEYVPNFITEQEEQFLAAQIQQTELHSFMFQGYEAKRKVASYGYDWSFDRRMLSKGKEIPESFQFIIERVAQHLKIKAQDFAELLLTEYPTGSVINWHRDAPPFDLIAGISLLSDCTFKLRPYNKTKQGRNSIISFEAKRRSLYIMQGPAREEWQHSIGLMNQLRYSITLRTLIKGV